LLVGGRKKRLGDGESEAKAHCSHDLERHTISLVTLS